MLANTDRGTPTGLDGNGGAARRADGHEAGSPLPTFAPRAPIPAPADADSLFSYSVDSQSGRVHKTLSRLAYRQPELDEFRSSPNRRQRSKRESVENAVYDLVTGLCWLGLGFWTTAEEARCPAGEFAGYWSVASDPSLPALSLTSRSGQQPVQYGSCFCLSHGPSLPSLVRL